MFRARKEEIRVFDKFSDVNRLILIIFGVTSKSQRLQIKPAMAKKRNNSDSSDLFSVQKTDQEIKIENVQDLYNYLFEACNILRGPVSQDNFKDYITPILYFKRISDVYDEETQSALEESNGDKEYAALPEQHSLTSRMVATGKMSASARKTLAPLSLGRCAVSNWPIRTLCMVFFQCFLLRNGRTSRT